jgi:glycosyltransferase involved in cell wall biosynthesis
MKVLIVCSGNLNGANGPFKLEIHRPFIWEQILALNNIGVETDIFLIRGKGIRGYLKNLRPLKNKIASGRYDLIHAHNGLSGLLACLQRKLTVVCTFHGSDLYDRKKRYFSFLALRLSAHAIYVSKEIKKKGTLIRRKNYSVIPCGVDPHVFYELDKQEARKKMGLDPGKHYALFSSSFDRPVKNFPLVRQAVKHIPGLEVLEFKGYTRPQANYLLNACDLLVLSSYREGSPQVVKEAMACSCPMVTTDVGDIREVTGSIDGCYISSFNPGDFADNIRKALRFGKRTNGRQYIGPFDNRTIAAKVKTVYEQVCSRVKKRN